MGKLPQCPQSLIIHVFSRSPLLPSSQTALPTRQKGLRQLHKKLLMRFLILTFLPEVERSRPVTYIQAGLDSLDTWCILLTIPLASMQKLLIGSPRSYQTMYRNYSPSAQHTANTQCEAADSTAKIYRQYKIMAYQSQRAA